MDALVALDALDDLIHNAPNAFLSDDVRLDPDKVAELLWHLRTGLRSEIHDAERSESWKLVDELETVVRDARPGRMDSRVRVDPDVLYEWLDRLRSIAPEEIRGSLGR